MVFAGSRFLLAGLLILLWMKIGGQSLRPAGELGTYVRVAVFQTFLQYVLIYVGLAYSSGTTASVIAGTSLLFQMLFAPIFVPGETIGMRRWIGAAIGFAGVVTVEFRPDTWSWNFG
jgi:drug/metabolite transporter (DMT)-like permease